MTHGSGTLRRASAGSAVLTSFLMGACITGDGDNSASEGDTPKSVRLALYDPGLDHTSCQATYRWTYGPLAGTEVTRSASGTETVDYTSGSIVGKNVPGGPGSLYGFGSNDGTTLKAMGSVQLDGSKTYMSTDCDMTAHPQVWSFGTIQDGTLLDQGVFSFVTPASSTCMTLDTQSILFAIQDLTVQGTLYLDAIVWWTLGESFSFTALVDTDPLANLGIALPSGSETGGHAITGFSVSAQGVGYVAGGDVDARSGVLRDVAELVTLECI